MEIDKRDILIYLSKEDRDELREKLNEQKNQQGCKESRLSGFYPVGSVYCVWGCINGKLVIRFFDNDEEAIKEWFELCDIQETLRNKE